MVEPLIFDMQGALERVERDKSLYAELYTIFSTEYQSMIGAVKAAQAARDGQKLRSSAHALKSAAGNLGAMRVHALAQLIESNAHHGLFENNDTSITGLEEAVRDYKTAAENFLAR